MGGARRGAAAQRRCRWAVAQGQGVTRGSASKAGRERKREEGRHTGLSMHPSGSGRGGRRQRPGPRHTHTPTHIPAARRSPAWWPPMAELVRPPMAELVRPPAARAHACEGLTLSHTLSHTWSHACPVVGCAWAAERAEAAAGVAPCTPSWARMLGASVCEGWPLGSPATRAPSGST
jgi:hypothetical protein